MPGFSVLVLTKNEEKDLPACLQSVAYSDDVVVYDSFSSDRTYDLARSAGARFIQRADQDRLVAYGGDEGFHRTWGIHQIRYKHSWLLVIDADERLTPEAAAELQAVVSNPDPRTVAYRIRRRDFFLGQHLRFAQMTRRYIRFFRPQYVHYERLVNPVTIVDGLVGNLHYPLDHYPFSKGVKHWIERHNVYSDFEAVEIHKVPARLSMCSFRALLDGNQAKRRAGLKRIYYSLPFRPLVKFSYMYIFRLGFLDGRAGLVYSLLVAFYELIIAIKVEEARQK